MIETLCSLSFFAMWWLLLLDVVEPDFLSLSSLTIFGTLCALMIADRHVQKEKENEPK